MRSSLQEVFIRSVSPPVPAALWIEWFELTLSCLWVQDNDLRNFEKINFFFFFRSLFLFSYVVCLSPFVQISMLWIDASQLIVSHVASLSRKVRFQVKLKIEVENVNKQREIQKWYSKNQYIKQQNSKIWITQFENEKNFFLVYPWKEMWSLHEAFPAAHMAGT